MNKETDSRTSTRKEQITQDTKNPHAILGLGKNATISDIKKAYRKLSLQYHPDKWANESKEVQKQMRENFDIVKKAYEMLTKSITENLFDALADENLEEARNLSREVPNLNAQQYVSQYGMELTPIHLIVRNIGATPGKGHNCTNKNYGKEEA